MHEQAMARRLVAATIEETVGRPIRRVRVELTPLSGTSPAALRSAWEAAAAGTPAAGADLVVEERPVRLICDTCGAAHRPDSPHDVLCGGCGSPVPGVGPADPVVRVVAVGPAQDSSDSTSRSSRSSSA